VDWPHSLRATRVKLIELSRLRAKEKAAEDQRRESIAEEPEDASDIEANYTYTQVTSGAKRPPYRQSSMDFMNAEGTDIKNNEHLARYVLSPGTHHAWLTASSLAFRLVCSALSAKPLITLTSARLVPIAVLLRPLPALYLP
jgi:hypothetical protein